VSHAENEIVVTGLGMASSLGGVVQACAAARAGIVRPRGLGLDALDIDEMAPAPVMGHPAPHLTDGFRGVARWMRLGAAALDDLGFYAQRLPEPEKSGCLWVLPSRYLHDVAHSLPEERTAATGSTAPPPFLAESDGPRLWDMLSRFTRLELPTSPRALLWGDHHGFVVALQRAAQWLREQTVEACLVGAIDSLVEPETAGLLAELRLLKSAESPVGMMPGEAAAFCVLERRATALRRGARIEAILEPPAITQERIHRFSALPSTGEALAEVMQRVATPAADEPVGQVLHNLNGDAWRAMEWGSALCRLPPESPLRNGSPWLPAASFGDTGATSGALALCMGTRAFTRRYARTRRILVALSSYSGEKGAFVLRSPE
jgi:hypothetical protein